MSFVQAPAFKSTNSSSTIVMNAFASAPGSSANNILVYVAVDNAGLTNGSCTDNQSGGSNTYVIDFKDSQADGIWGYWFRSTSALNTGAPLTVTVTGSAGNFWSGVPLEATTLPTGNITTGSSGSVSTHPFSAVTGALNANDFVVAGAVVNGNVANEGLSDPPTGGSGAWNSLGAQQNTSTSTGAGAAYKQNGTGGAETATWDVTAAFTFCVGIVVGYKSAAASVNMMGQACL